MQKIVLHRLKYKDNKLYLAIKARRTKKQILLHYELDKTFEEFAYDVFRGHYDFNNLKPVWNEFKERLQKLFSKSITKEKAFQNKFFIEICDIQKQLIKRGPKNENRDY